MRVAVEARRAVSRRGEQRTQVEAVDARFSGRRRPEQIDAADRLAERSQPEPRQRAADVLGHEGEEGHDLLGGPRELLAQLWTLRGDADRARVDVARAHHQAALGEEERSPEADLVGAEKRGDDHVPSRLEAAVGADADAASQPVRDERLLRLGQAELPGRAGVLDRGQRARAGAAVRAGDVHGVGERLHDAGSHEADAALGDELDRDGRIRVHLLEVEDELRQVLDRVDVVVRRR